MQTGETRSPNRLTLWWWRRLARRRQLAHAAGDLHERYGPAAYAIARNSARRGGATERRFWRGVTRRLRRGQWPAARAFKVVDA
jgi:hypothetical protein